MLHIFKMYVFNTTSSWHISSIRNRICASIVRHDRKITENSLVCPTFNFCSLLSSNSHIYSCILLLGQVITWSILRSITKIKKKKPLQIYVTRVYELFRMLYINRNWNDSITLDSWTEISIVLTVLYPFELCMNLWNKKIT